MSNNKNSCQKIHRSRIFLILFVIIIGSVIIRMHYFSFEIPLTSDALVYFYYASDIAVTGNLPNNYSPANPGWPMFVSGFFHLLNFETVNEFMQTQKILSIIISVITVIPIYFLCRKFLDQRFSVLGCVLFAFEPHLIQNSLLGITEPLYILLITSAISMSLSSNKKVIFLSFVIVGLSTSVRSEGLFVFLAMMSILIIKVTNNKRKILILIFCILIFGIVITPVAYYKYNVMGNDTLLMRASSSIDAFTDSDVSIENPNIGTSFENFPKYFGWALIPILIIFVPIGIISIIKRKGKNLWIIFSVSILIILPMIYAYSIPLKDVRYVFYLFPILIIISTFGIKFISEKFSNKKIIKILFVVFIIISSISFIEWKIEKSEIGKDIFKVSQITVFSTTGVNSFSPESRFLESAEIPKKWEDYKKYFDIEREDKKSIIDTVNKQVTIFETSNYQSLEDFINASGLELTHLVADDNPNRPEFMKNVYKNGENIEFLKKEFDSTDMNLKYNVKIFKINYELFDRKN